MIDFTVLQRIDLVAKDLKLGLYFIEDLAMSTDVQIKPIFQWYDDPDSSKCENRKKLNLTVGGGLTVGLLDNMGVGNVVKVDDYIDIVTLIDLLFDLVLSR